MVKSRIKDDSVTALKAGNGRRVEVLRFLISLLDKRELSLPIGGMTEEEELAVLRKEMKHKEEAREMFLKGERADLAKEIDEEIEILKNYLPSEADDDEIKKIVLEVILEKEKNFGLVMGETMKRLAGRAHGDRVSAIVKECLT